MCMDGTFKLFYKSGYAMLQVTLPNQGGRPVFADDVSGRMKILGIPRVRRTQIQDIINSGNSKPLKLIYWPEGAALSGAVNVLVSEDKIGASVILSPHRKGGAELQLKDVLEHLTGFGITYGIRNDSICGALEKKLYNISIPAAEGRLPANGRGRAVKYHFLTDRGKPFLLMDFDRINLKELNFIQNKEEGDILVEFLPAVPALDGVDVFGAIIPAETAAEEVLPKAGNNTIVDGDKIIAVAQGNAVLVKNKITIEPVIVVENVNYETGNIDFDGTVEVRKSISDGFSVKASGDVQIGLCAGRVEISAGRNVLLTGGINGGSTGRCSAGGDVIAHYIESSSVKAEGSIMVQEAVMHSDLVSGGDIIIKGKRAEVIGGTAVAAGSLWCRKIGAVNETVTSIILGVYPRAMKEYRLFSEKLVELQDLYDTRSTNIKQLKKRILLQSDQYDLILKSKKAVQQLVLDNSRDEEQIRKCKTEKKRLIKYFSKNPEVIAVAEEIIYPGVNFRIGLHEMKISNQPMYSTFLTCELETIVQKGFNQYSPPVIPAVPDYFDFEKTL